MKDKEPIKTINKASADIIGESSGKRDGVQPQFRFGRVFGVAAGVLLLAACVVTVLFFSSCIKHEQLPPGDAKENGTLACETIPPATPESAMTLVLPPDADNDESNENSAEVPLTPTAVPTALPSTSTVAPGDDPSTSTAEPTEIPTISTGVPTALTATSTPTPTPAPTLTPTPESAPTPTPTPTSTPTTAPTSAPTPSPYQGNESPDTLVDINRAMMTNQYKNGVYILRQNTDLQGLKSKLKRFVARVKADAEFNPDSVESILLFKANRLEDTDYSIDYWSVGTDEELDSIACIYQNNLDRIKVFLLEVDGELYPVNGDCQLKICEIKRCDYDSNGVDDLAFTAFNEERSRMFFGVFDRTMHTFRFMTEITDNMSEVMLGSIGNNVYLANLKTRTAGRLGYDGSGLTLGGLTPDAFVKKVFTDMFDGAPDLNDMPEPSATIAPYMDPERAEYLLNRYNFVTVSQTGKPWNYTHMSKSLYAYTGSGMVLEEYISGRSDVEYTDWLGRFIYEYASGESTYAISVSQDFSIDLIDGGELLSLDVYDLYGNLLHSEITFDALYALAQSGGLPFTADPESGTTYPCFAVFEVKKYAAYFSETGEREYAVMYSVIPFEP